MAKSFSYLANHNVKNLSSSVIILTLLLARQLNKLADPMPRALLFKNHFHILALDT